MKAVALVKRSRGRNNEQARFWDSLVDVGILHFPVVFGQFDRKDDAGDEVDQAPTEAEPEYILEGERTRKEEEMEQLSFKMRTFWGRKAVGRWALTSEFTT